jgi:hypothetical protein
MNHQISRVVTGIALTLAFVLITTVLSVINNVLPAHAKQNAVVRGSVNLTPANNRLTIKLNLQNIPPGPHRADLHQGSCPLTFQVDGQDSKFGPFTPGVTLPLGNVQAANGILKKTITLKESATLQIPDDLVSSGKWFFCIHTGTLAQLAKVKNPTPAKLLAALKKIPPAQVKQLACQKIDGANIQVNGVEGA